MRTEDSKKIKVKNLEVLIRDYVSSTFSGIDFLNKNFVLKFDGVFIYN